MSKRVYRCSLDPQSIRRVIEKIAHYERELPRKAEELRRVIAERIADEAKNGFAVAIVDDILKGETKIASVDVSVDEKGTMSVVLASGEDAVWCEFGTGVYYNGAVGNSPHPKGAELGFTIGGYGKGAGAKRVWGFYENGELRLTHGAPASMPMYNAMQRVCDEIAGAAREVFGM